MSADIQSPDKMIRDQAAWSFRRSPEARTALHWFRANPERFEEITNEFDTIIKNMNLLLKGNDPIDQDNFGGVARLKQAIPDLNQSPLLSLEELTKTVNSKEHNDVIQAIMDTLSEVGSGLSIGGDWNWVAKEAPRVMGSALLIEGYARMLARYWHNDKIKRDFALGFEETGWVFVRNSSIIQDVKKWMKDPDEIGEVSPNVRQQLQVEA